MQDNGGYQSGRIMRPSDDDTDYESFIGLMGKRSTGKEQQNLDKMVSDISSDRLR